MAANWYWCGAYSAGETTAELGQSGNLFNFKTLDSLTGAADYTSFPITAGANSYEVWLKGLWNGTFNEISNLQFWNSAGGPDTGVSIYWDGQITTYDTPVTAASAEASAVVPTSDPGTANVSITGDLAGTHKDSTEGFSDYVVLQMQTTTGADAGDTSTYTFTLQYDEN